MTAEPVYDRIGRGYASARRSEPSFARRIEAALGGADAVLNVGAGTGSYEPAGARVVAVEPSRAMIAQRRAGTPVVRGVAEALPFADGAFAAAMAVLTIHHWTDWRAGVSEMRRVASRVAILTWDPEAAAGFWLFRYFPGIAARDRERFPALGELEAAAGGRAEALPVPHDCADGFLGAYWRRPAAYLDGGLRRAISGFALLPPAETAHGLARLEADLAGGEWERRFGALRERAALDLGYRLVAADAERGW